MNLSIIIPVFNCDQWITSKIDELVKLLKEIEKSEIIFVDDCSKDNTVEVITNYILNIENVRLIKLNVNQGKGSAVMRGLNESNADYRIFTDCDLAYPISEIRKVYEKLSSSNHIGMVIANRRDPKSICELNPKYFKHVYKRERSGAILNKFLKLLRLTLFDDTQAGLKGFKGSNINAFDRISIFRFGFDIELLIIAVKNNIVIEQIPVRYIYHDDESTVSMIKDGFSIISDSMKIFLNDRFHKHYDNSLVDKT